MLHIKHRVVALWITLLVMVAGAIIPSAYQFSAWLAGSSAPEYSTLSKLSPPIITLEICDPSGKLITYTVNLADDPQVDDLQVDNPQNGESGLSLLAGHQSGGSEHAHCLFCILPSSLDTVVELHSVKHGLLNASLTVFFITSTVSLPHWHDRWQPHLPLAPPQFLSKTV